MITAKDVYNLVCQIPKGRVSTYGAIASVLGNPRASRAVGRILNKNPYLVDIPCHRIVRSDGRVGGYAGGVEKKARILESEGVQVRAGRIKKFVEKIYLLDSNTSLYCP